MSFLNICLRIPNLDTIIFYIIFVIAIPAAFLANNDFNSLQYYLPALIMLAVTLTESGKPYLFKNLYPQEITNFSGFLSRNFINGLALVGLLAQAILVSMATGSLALGLVTGLITFTVAYPLAQQVLPFFINEVDDLTKFVFAGRVNFPANWHRYFAGFLLSAFLIGVQFILLVGVTRYVLSSGASTI